MTLDWDAIGSFAGTTLIIGFVLLLIGLMSWAGSPATLARSRYMQRMRRMAFYMIAQASDGGREVIYDDFPSVDDAQDAAMREFKRELPSGVRYVACVIYVGNPGSSGLKRGEAIVTLFNDYSTKRGEQWPLPELPQYAVIREDLTVDPPTRKVYLEQDQSLPFHA